MCDTPVATSSARRRLSFTHSRTEADAQASGCDQLADVRARACATAAIDGVGLRPRSGASGRGTAARCSSSHRSSRRTVVPVDVRRPLLCALRGHWSRGLALDQQPLWLSLVGDRGRARYSDVIGRSCALDVPGTDGESSRSIAGPERSAGDARSGRPSPRHSSRTRPRLRRRLVWPGEGARRRHRRYALDVYTGAREGLGGPCGRSALHRLLRRTCVCARRAHRPARLARVVATPSRIVRELLLDTAVDYDRVYVGATDGKIYSFGAETGRLRWSRSTGGFVYAAAAVWRGLILIGSYDHVFYALDAATGRFAGRCANGAISAQRRGRRPRLLLDLRASDVCARRSHGSRLWT